MKTIANTNPGVPTRVTLTQPIAALCPHSGEPQTGSTLAVTYTAGAVLLELHAIEEWLPSVCGEALDVETLCQKAAQAAASALGVPVEAEAMYKLRNGLELRCLTSYSVTATTAGSPK